MNRDDLLLRSFLHWDDRGVLLNASRKALARGEPWQRQGMSTVALRWERLVEVRDGAIWPDFAIKARERSVGPVDYLTSLWRLLVSGTARGGLSLDSIGRHVESFLDDVGRRGLAPPDVGGWTGASDVTWEPVHTLPHRDRAEPILSPFRTRAVPMERVVHVWESRLPVWMQWMVGRGRAPLPHFVDRPNAIVIGEENLYASSGGVAVRVPLASLRARIEEVSQRSQEQIAVRLVFGRRTELRVAGNSWEAVRKLAEERVPEHQRVIRLPD